MDKKLQRLMILKLKNSNFTSEKYLIFIDDVDIDEILISNNVSFGKNCLLFMLNIFLPHVQYIQTYRYIKKIVDTYFTQF